MTSFKETLIYEFIDHIIKYDSIDDILSECCDESVKQHVFERLFDIIIYFGFCDVFNKNEWQHLCVNCNPTKLEIYLNEHVINNNSHGCLDITLKYKESCEFTKIMSKYPETSDYIDYYDIFDFAMMQENERVHRCVPSLYFIVCDKTILFKKVKYERYSTNTINEIIKNCIFDKNDLQKFFLAFKKSITKNGTTYIFS
jgi:hypothetical protein